MDCDHPGDPGRPVVVAVHQPDPARVEQARGTGPWPRPAAPARRRPCPSRPGPCGIASSDRHEQQVRGSARRHGHGPESSPVPTVPKNALFAGVSGILSSVPSSDPAFSGLLLPMVTAPGQPRPGAPARPSRARGPAVPPGAPRPARSASPRPPAPTPAATAATTDQRQVPGQRGDHVLDPGTRHERHQHDHPDHERRRQQPLPLALREPAVQPRARRDPADDARPGLRFQPSSSGPSVA